MLYYSEVLKLVTEIPKRINSCRGKIMKQNH